MRTALTGPLTVLAAQVLLIAGLAVTAGLDGSGLGPAGWAVGLACGGVMSLALARGRSYWGTDRLGPADWVTLVRATLAVDVAALVADSFAEPVPVALLVSLASLALILDAVDGRIARRTDTASALGEHMDAEVDTVSSHEPWNRIPEEIGWNQVGNGSIYSRIPMSYEGGSFLSFWDDASHVRAGYRRSIVYTLNSLTSFVQHYGKKNLVLIVLGDHQPKEPVTGEHAGHQVPISIIAQDPKVLKGIESWGWGPGLRPRPDAPVWPMSAFRNRFLTAFDSEPAAP